ncbi:MAG TPA: group 1 glycosyl transferase [Porphyromonadaceae bacterium]|nr:group 1 glycosyl transferase [Porphyromonadaceae bacterium]
MMKIAVIVTSLSNSGPVIVAHDLICLLMQKGHECNIFYFKEKKENTLTFPCKVERINLMSFRVHFGEYDIVHCHGLRPNIYATLHNPLWCKTPVLTTMHNYVFEDFYYGMSKYLYKPMAYLMLFSTFRKDKVITLSKDAMKYYSRYIPKKKLTYAYNSRLCEDLPVEKELEEKVLSFKGNDILVGSVGSISKRKNFHQVINSLPFLNNIKYCIVGDGVERETLEKLAIKNGVQDRVLFLGGQPNAYRFMKYFDLFVLPSKSEGFPLVLIEAMFYHKGIVCSHLQRFEELFEDNEVCYFELDNIPSTVNAIQKASKKYKALGEKIYNHYVQSYSPECFVNRHLEIYREIISIGRNL